MKRVPMALHLQCPVGLWRIVCTRCQPRNLRDGSRVIFTHLHERRA